MMTPSPPILKSMFLDSERNDECIDFTNMFFFIYIFCVTFWDSTTASIFLNSILFNGKVNLVGVLGGKNLKFLIVFKSAEKNKIKVKEKRKFLRKIEYFGFLCNYNTNDIFTSCIY